jgi:hypothetical protein
MFQIDRYRLHDHAQECCELLTVGPGASVHMYDLGHTPAAEMYTAPQLLTLLRTNDDTT